MNMVNVLLFSAAAVLVAVTAAGEESLRRRSTVFSPPLPRDWMRPSISTLAAV